MRDYETISLAYDGLLGFIVPDCGAQAPMRRHMGTKRDGCTSGLAYVFCFRVVQVHTSTLVVATRGFASRISMARAIICPPKKYHIILRCI